jgi:hypothetical protein
MANDPGGVARDQLLLVYVWGKSPKRDIELWRHEGVTGKRKPRSSIGMKPGRGSRGKLYQPSAPATSTVKGEVRALAVRPLVGTAVIPRRRRLAHVL